LSAVIATSCPGVRIEGNVVPHTQVALPAGEDKDGRVTLEGTGENLYPLYPEAHPGQRSELVLAQPLQLANKANRFANRNVNAQRSR
jgi:hypothetical protein